MPRLAHINPMYRKHRPNGQATVTICGKTFLPWPLKQQGQQNRVRPHHR
jgi:hypothetical protein